MINEEQQLPEEEMDGFELFEKMRDNPALKEKMDKRKIKENQEEIIEEDDNQSHEPNQEDIQKEPVKEQVKKELKEPREDKNEIINKLNKRLSDNTNYSTSILKNRDKAVSHVRNFIESGDISQEHADTLLSILNNKTGKEPEGLIESYQKSNSSNSFQKFYDIANYEIAQTYQDATGDNSLEDKQYAYDAFMSDATEKERQEIYNQLEKLENSPMALFKKMISIGEKFIEDGYGELINAGGFRKYATQNKEKVNELHHKIDELSKKLLKYEQKSEYDRPNHDIGGTIDSSRDGIDYNQDDPFLQFEKERDSGRQYRRG